MSYASSYLTSIPDNVSQDDRVHLDLAPTSSFGQRARLYENLLEMYHHPYFMVRVADVRVQMESDATALELYVQAQRTAKEAGIVDTVLDAFIDRYRVIVHQKVESSLAMATQGIFYQLWKPTKEHKFPLILPHPPPGHEDVLAKWNSSKSSGTEFFMNYLNSLSIETNHIESTFLLTDGSTQDLIRRGISDGSVNYLPESTLKDPALIKSILNDTLAAYTLLQDICNNPKELTREMICRIHACLMRSSRINTQSMTYINPGITRSTTKKSVVISGTYRIQTCPFPDVDAELEYICRMARQYIVTWKNPFATASWLHLIIARCHPFEDGNGRIARLIASLPLIWNGYPPIYVALSQRQAYYNAINKCYDGVHERFVQCILEGMQESLASLKDL